MLVGVDRLAARVANARRLPAARGAPPVLHASARVPRSHIQIRIIAVERLDSRTTPCRHNSLRFLGRVSNRTCRRSCTSSEPSASGAILSPIQSVVFLSIPVLRGFEHVAPPSRAPRTLPAGALPTSCSHIRLRCVPRHDSLCERVRRE